MLEPESAVISCSSWREIVTAYNQIIKELEPEVRQQLGSVMENYLLAFDLEGVYERLNGRTVAQVLAEYREAAAPPLICSGELDGLRYTLYDARPSEDKTAK